MLGSSLLHLQNQILPFVAARGKHRVENVREETQLKVGLAYVLDRTRYFALLSRKWYYLILKRKETGTELVAIATRKCVLSGIFRRVQHPCQVSIAFNIGRVVLDFVSHHCTLHNQ